MSCSARTSASVTGERSAFSVTVRLRRYRPWITTAAARAASSAASSSLDAMRALPGLLIRRLIGAMPAAAAATIAAAQVVLAREDQVGSVPVAVSGLQRKRFARIGLDSHTRL